MTDHSPIARAMRVRAHPTVAEIERELRAGFMDDRVVLRYAELHDSVGLWKPEGTRRVITVDPFRAALPILIHELLHEARGKHLETWGQMEEIVTEAVEDGIERFINRSKSRVAWWRQTVRAKEVE